MILTEPKRLNRAQLRRAFSSARNSPDIDEALARVQDATLAANGLLDADETTRLREKIEAAE